MPNLAVFSTSVEVFPEAVSKSRPNQGLLHVRGGVSESVVFRARNWRSSPRPWRCFSRNGRSRKVGNVFSTSVEVFPIIWKKTCVVQSLLHVRGGVSSNGYTTTQSSYVFSTSVEVFPMRTPRNWVLIRLLHVRGGVSGGPISRTTYAKSSPRPWRCFPEGGRG